MREMKDSGIEWIKHIPIEWESKTIRHLLISRDGGAWGEDVPDGETGTICMRIADFEYEKGCFKDSPLDSLTKRRYMDYQIKRLKLEKGDILIEKSGGGEKTPVGRSVIFDKGYFALFANFMERLRFNPSTILSEYVEYWLRTWYSCRCSPFYINQTTGIQNLNLTLMLAKERIFYPNIHEQSRIVSYLDTKCSEIDALVADIQKQIDTLEEYKRSLIFDTICHGICNEKQKNTDSDVWTEIPVSWDLRDIKYIFKIVKRIAGKEGFDVLSVTQKGLKVKNLNDNGGQLAENYSGYQFVYPTDYVMNHMDLLTGWVDCSTLFGVTSPDYRVFRLRDKKRNDLTYFKYVMQCCYLCRIFYSLGQGVSNLGRWRLQTSSFNNFRIPVPPLEQQKIIANYLDSKCAEIDSIISEKKQQIETIEEYKKSLIFEYVTGKKEVDI